LAAHALSEAQGTQRLFTVSQMGLLATRQSLLVVHSTQVPADEQAGFVASRAAQAPLPAAKHPTHFSPAQKALPGSRRQSPSPTHSRHLPEAASHAGVADGQPASTAAHETQAWLGEQMGVPPPPLHWPALRQATHWPWTQ
jgi:hypothetical protein